jgi:hypothetical protein
MITKEEYIASISFDFNVIRHLASKIQPETFDWKPTPTQRTIHELMTYMGHIFGLGMDMILEGDAKRDANIEKWKATTPAVTLENFSELITKQEKYINEVVGNMSEEQLNEKIALFGNTQSRAVHLLNGPLKWASAYKMQLFLYLKATGQSHLNTMNLWVGMDPMPKE